DVLDQRRVDARPLDERAQHAGVEIDRMHRRQRAARAAPPERRAHDINDHGAAHASSFPERIKSPAGATRATSSPCADAPPETWRRASASAPAPIRATTAAGSRA